MFVSAPGVFVTPLYQALRFEGPRLSSSAHLRNRAEVAAPPQSPLYADISTLKSVHTWSRKPAQAHRRTSGLKPGQPRCQATFPTGRSPAAHCQATAPGRSTAESLPKALGRICYQTDGRPPLNTIWRRLCVKALIYGTLVNRSQSAKVNRTKSSLFGTPPPYNLVGVGDVNTLRSNPYCRRYVGHRRAALARIRHRPTQI